MSSMSLWYVILFLAVSTTFVVTSESEVEDSVDDSTTNKDATSENDAPEQYVVDLDEDNFHRTVLDTTKNFIVEFYSGVTEWSKSYAPTYEKVAQVFKDEPNCVVAKVDINKYRNLGRIYEWGGMMKFYFFPADKRIDGELYQGSRALNHFVEFLNEKCGTNRLPDGRLDTSKGRLPSFDKLSNDFFVTMGTLDNTTKEAGTYYINVMKKIMENGDSFVADEMARLEKVLKEYMTSEKRVSTITRYNILKHFSKQGATEEDVVEGEGHVTPDEGEGDKIKSVDDILMEAAMTGQPVTGNIHQSELKNEL